MINHFRTLLLNALPTSSPVSFFSEYIPPDFKPISATTQEKMVRGILLGGDSTRASQEIGASIVFRLMYDNIPLRTFMDSIDSRLSFDPMVSWFSEPSREGIEYPTIPVIWSALGRSGVVPALFRSMGRYREELLGFSQEMSKAERLDSKVAFVAIGLCLHTEERRLTE